ncbi:unnamed protein product [Penicillium bialowiezense]
MEKRKRPASTSDLARAQRATRRAKKRESPPAPSRSPSRTNGRTRKGKLHFIEETKREKEREREKLSLETIYVPGSLTDKASTPGSRHGLSTLSTDTADSLSSLVNQAQARIQTYESQSLEYDTLVQPGLNAFLRWLPETGQTSLARDVISTPSDSQLYNVFQNLYTGLAVPMRSRSRAPSVVESPHPKRQKHVEAVASTLAQPEKRNASFATQLQQRDNFRCVITAQVNTDQWERDGEPDDIFHGPTEGAHIIPFAFSSWPGASGASRDRSSTWAVLYKCFPELRRHVSADTINSLRNGITLRDHVHTQFGKFAIALQPTPIQNEYIVKTYKRYPPDDITAIPADRRVRFEPSTKFEIPSRAILDAHWRMCEIFNACAMGKTIEQHIRDWEELRGSECAVVREDGSTDLASLLDIALWGHPKMA